MSRGLLDVVNDRDEVVDRATRAEVHRAKLLHRAVHVWVFDGAGRLLLQKRSLSKDSHPGKWDSSCSGHVDAGEGYLESAVRELEEELGLAVKAEDLLELDYVVAGAETDWEFVRLYGLVRNGPFRMEVGEIDELKFYTFDELDTFVQMENDLCARAFRSLLLRHVGELVDLQVRCFSVSHGQGD